MDSLLLLSTGAAVVYASLGSLALVLRLGRPQETEHGFGMAVSFAMCAFAILRTLAIRWPDASEPLSRMMTVCAIGAIVAACHFVVLYTRPRNPTVWLGTIYPVGVGYSILAITGNLKLISLRGSIAPDGLGVFGRPETISGWSLYIVAAAAMSVATLASMRRRMSGAREQAGLAFGTTIWLTTIVHDAAIAAGTIGGPWLMQVGVLSFVTGTGAAFISRYLHIANELEKSTLELERRTTQLRQSYHDLRETQEELVKKEQLAVVGELAAVVAHEVRNPLAVIANAVAGLRKPSISREDHITLLGILEDESSRLNRLVSDLLRYARPVSVQRSRVVLDDLLERALRFARASTTVTVQKATDVSDSHVYGDASLLRQVFDNLVDNAVQAMPHGGSLSIQVRAAREEGVEGVSVLVGDTGEGMDTIVRARAKDPFFTTRPSGTGLGLAIVDRIVEAHSGHLLIQSRAGEGTTVTVFLPHGRPSDIPEVTPERPIPKDSGTQSKTVVVEKPEKQEVS
jgi:signal transduction histidine kinase